MAPVAGSSRGAADPVDDDASIIAGSWTNPERFGALFDRHAVAIHRYLVRRVGRDDADDLLAEVFVAAFRARDRYDLQRPDARPWLYGIATNLSARTFRSRTRAAAAADRLSREEIAEADLQAAHTDRLDAEASWPRLAEALDRLPEGQSEALLLYVWADLTYEQISVATGVPIGTVRSRISRARRSLRELLETQRETTERRAGHRERVDRRTDDT